MCKSFKKDIILLTAVLAIILCLGSCSLIPKANSTEDFSYPYILPNTYIGDVNVGGLTQEGAMAALTEAAQASVSDNIIVIDIDSEKHELSDLQTAEYANQSALVTTAYNNGRTGDDQKDYDNALETEFRLKADIMLSTDFDRLQAQLDDLAAEINRDYTATEFTISENNMTMVRGQSGRNVRVDLLYTEIANRLAAQDYSELIWSCDTIFPSGDEKELGDEALAEALLKFHDEVCTEAVDAHYDSETGELIPEVTGLSFDYDSALQLLLSLEPGSSYTLEIQKVQPEITSENIPRQLYTDLLSSYSSDLSGSTPNRKNNLTLVCEAINGTTLQPGEVFSFNDTVGQRTAEKGYKSAGVYISGQTQDQLGGGICQAASTIYLAAMQANLEIVERTAHEFLVTYVPMGCDATIYWEVYDFKFKNSTDYPLKICSNVADDCVNVELWGTNATGQYAEITYEVLSTSGYSCITREDSTKEEGYSYIETYPYTGYKVKTYRNVYDKDGNLLSTEFEADSNYHSRNQVTVIGTKKKETAAPVVSEPIDTAPPAVSEPEPLPELIIGDVEDSSDTIEAVG